VERLESLDERIWLQQSEDPGRIPMQITTNQVARFVVLAILVAAAPGLYGQVAAPTVVDHREVPTHLAPVPLNSLPASVAAQVPAPAGPKAAADPFPKAATQLHADSTPQQIGLPVIFVHGICEKVTDWEPLTLPVVSSIHQAEPALYPSQLIYAAVAWGEPIQGVTFYDEQGMKPETPGSTARFFSIAFHDAGCPSCTPNGTIPATVINPVNVMNSAISEKGDELAAVIKQIKQITNSPKVILIAHSLGGLDSRSYIENLGASLSHRTGEDSDILALTTIDTPHMGSPWANVVSSGVDPEHLLTFVQQIDPNLSSLQCLINPSIDMNEMTTSSINLKILNYSLPNAGDIPTTIAFDSIASYDDNYGSFFYPLSLDGLVGTMCQTIGQGQTNDGAVCTESQILKNSLGSYVNLSSLNISEPVSIPVVSCPSGSPIIHLIGCTGAQESTQLQVETDILGNSMNNNLDVEPQGMVISPGQTLQFTANGSSTGYYWNLLEDPASNLIDEFGNFSATNYGTYTVVATDQPTGRTYGMTTVTVAAAPQQSTLQLNVAGAGTGNAMSSPAGISCGLTCSASFPSNTSVTLIATPDPGMMVFSWKGCNRVSGNSCMVEMGTGQIVTLTFATESSTELPPPSLNPVQIGGTAAAPQATFSWSQVTHNSGYHLMVAMQQSALPTDPNVGSCPDCNLILKIATNTTSYFQPTGLSPGTTYYWQVHALAVEPYSPGQWSSVGSFTTGSAQGTVQVSLLGDGAGNVSSAPTGIQCPGTCTAGFSPNAQVTLTAAASVGSAFQSWGGACSGTGSCLVTASGVQSVYANFDKPADYQLVVGVAGNGTVKSADGEIDCTNSGGVCAATYANGSTVTLTPTPGQNFQMGSWSNACNGSGTCQITMNQNQFAIAQFQVSSQPNGKMLVSAPSFSPVFTQGESLAAIGLSVQNSSGGVMLGNAIASEQSGGNWLLIDGNGSETFSTPISLTITFNPAGLAPGTYSGSIVLTSSQASNSSVTVPVTMKIYAPLAIISSPTLPDVYGGKHYSTTLLASGGSGLIWNLKQGYLPYPVSLNASTGVISGTPDVGINMVTEPLTFCVQDSLGRVACANFTQNWHTGILITDWNQPQMVVGKTVTGGAGTNFVATNGIAPYTWSATGLPAGVTLSASGSLSGAPTAKGTFTATITATDTTGNSGSNTLPITVVEVPLTIMDESTRIPPLLSPLTVGASLGAGIWLEGNGGTQAGYAWSVSGTLPPGITHQTQTGCANPGKCSLEFLGTPTAAGSYSFSVTLTDSKQDSSTATLTWIVNNPGTGPKISTTTLPLATIGKSFSTTFSATGGKLPLAWKVDGGQLDPSLTLSAAGKLTGTPSITNDCDTGPAYYVGLNYPPSKWFYVQVTDANGESDQQRFCLPSYYPQPDFSSLSPTTITANGGSKTITVRGSNFLPTSQIFVQYEPQQTVYVSATELQVTLQPSSSAPLQLANGEGLGQSSWPLRVQENYAMPSAFGNFTIALPAPVITSVTSLYNTTTAPCTDNFPCQLVINGSGFNYSTSYQVVGNSQVPFLDAGPNSLEPWTQVVVDGFSPPAPGNYTIQVTNPNQANGGSASATGTFQVYTVGDIVPVPTQLTARLTQGGTPTSASLTVQVAGATGETGTVTASTQSGGDWLTVGGALSTGWTTGATIIVGFNPTGLKPGTYTGMIALSAPNATNGSVLVPVTMTVLTSLSITTAVSLPPATHGVAYSTTLQASGTGLQWSVLHSAELPLGLSLNPKTGVISGTPSDPASATTVSFDVGVEDSLGRSAWKEFTMAWQ
jgi:hypothetical protein